MPPGEYQLAASSDGVDGLVMAGVARDQFSIVTEPLSTVRAGLRLRLPVDIRSLIVRADDVADGEIREIVLRPVRLLRPSEQLTHAVARRAVRYGAAVVYFLDGSAFPEPSGFWVSGRDTASMVIATDSPAGRATLHLRNGPVANAVSIDDGSERRDVALAQDEERDVPVGSIRSVAPRWFEWRHAPASNRPHWIRRHTTRASSACSYSWELRSKPPAASYQ